MQTDSDAFAREHDRRLVELQSLFDLSKTLNSSLNLKSILDTLLLTPMGRLLISQGCMLLSDDQRIFKVVTVKGLHRELVGKAISVEEEWHDPKLRDEIKDSTAREFLQNNNLQLACPILSNNSCIGLLLLGGKLGGRTFSTDDLEYLSSLTNLAAPAVQNSKYVRELQGVNWQLDKKIQELNTLFDISKELNATLDQDKIANTLAYAIMGELMVQRFLLLLEEGQQGLQSLVAKGFRNQDDRKFLQNRQAIESILTIRTATHIDTIDDDHLAGALEKAGLSVLVPLIVQDKLKGCILVGGRLNNKPIQQDELEFLSTLGNAAMISLENARLFEETIEKQRLEEELSIAKDIQQKLLPSEPLSVPGFEFAGFNTPSRQVGGDYYDLVKIDNKRIAVAIGDVSGKGVGASLLMANLQASLHALIRAELELSDIVYRINNIIYANTSMDKFITFFLGMVDIEERTLTYVNAGHNPPYIRRDGRELIKLEAGGLILGMMPNMPYQQDTLTLQSGDLLVLFTDGVSEAMDEDDEEFEEWRVEEFICNFKKTSALELVKDLSETVQQFCGSAPQSDDITIVAVQVAP